MTDIGAPCDDGNLCSKNDSCQAGGVCLGVVDLPSPATNGCSIDVCDPADGLVKPQPTPNSNGTACDDGNACTDGSVCMAGNCGGGSVVNCGPGSTCDKLKGCIP